MTKHIFAITLLAIFIILAYSVAYPPEREPVVKSKVVGVTITATKVEGGKPEWDITQPEEIKEGER